jgi:hypothetical protein
MTFTEIVLDCIADENQTISYRLAKQYSKQHGVIQEFFIEYEDFSINERIDAPEFLVWLGY